MYVIIEHSDQQLLLNFLDSRQHLKSNSLILSRKTISKSIETFEINYK